MKRNFPIIVLGWLDVSIIKRCLSSINMMHNVNPQIYFLESLSKNSEEIKELVLSTPNVKGYIQMKENFAWRFWLVAMEYFVPLIDEEFISITDGDFVFDCESIQKQHELFDKYEDIGVVSQRRSTLWMKKDLKDLCKEDIGYFERDERNSKPWGGVGISRCTLNQLCLVTSRRQDWKTCLQLIRDQSHTWGTSIPGRGEVKWRSPIFCDFDLFRIFDNIMQKKSFIIESDPAYHITDERDHDSNSEYSKLKKENRYLDPSENDLGFSFVSVDHFEEYENDVDYFHDKFYEDGSLKYNIIK